MVRRKQNHLQTQKHVLVNQYVRVADPVGLFQRLAVPAAAPRFCWKPPDAVVPPRPPRWSGRPRAESRSPRDILLNGADSLLDSRPPCYQL